MILSWNLFLESLPWQVFSAKSANGCKPGFLPAIGSHELANRVMLRERLKAIEAHIRSRDLKTRKAVTMVQMAGEQGDGNRLKLMAWMFVADSDDIGSGHSVSNRDLK